MRNAQNDSLTDHWESINNKKPKFKIVYSNNGEGTETSIVTFGDYEDTFEGYISSDSVKELLNSLILPNYYTAKAKLAELEKAKKSLKDNSDESYQKYLKYQKRISTKNQEIQDLKNTYKIK